MTVRESSAEDAQELEPEETIHALEGQTALRVFAFLYTLLPIVVKIFCVRGIPWTRTWTIMYLADFLAFELLNLIETRHPVKSPSSRLTFQDGATDLFWKWNTRLEPAHENLGRLAWYIQMAWAATAPLLRLDSNNSRNAIIIINWSILGAFYIHVLQYISRGYMSRKQFPSKVFRTTFWRTMATDLWKIAALSSLNAMSLSAFTSGIYYASRTAPDPHTPLLFYHDDPSGLSFGLLCLYVFVPCCFLILTERSLLRWTFWRRNVYFLHNYDTGNPNRVESQVALKMERETAALFTSFLLISMNGFISYALFFDEESTLKPKRVEWLG